MADARRHARAGGGRTAPHGGQGRARITRRWATAASPSGNAEGGLTTIEEKSLGAYMPNPGSRGSLGLIKPGDLPPRGGLYLMDVVPDGEVRFGFPNISDNAEIVEMMASGAHIARCS